jgi:hypothetical protein
MSRCRRALRTSPDGGQGQAQDGADVKRFTDGEPVSSKVVDLWSAARLPNLYHHRHPDFAVYNQLLIYGTDAAIMATVRGAPGLIDAATRQ